MVVKKIIPPKWCNFKGVSKFTPRFIYRIVYWGMFYKTLQNRILRQTDRFRSKLVVASLLSVTNMLAWTNTLAYYGIRKLRIRNIFIVQAPGPYYIKLFLK